MKAITAAASSNLSVFQNILAVITLIGSLFLMSAVFSKSSKMLKIGLVLMFIGGIISVFNYPFYGLSFVITSISLFILKRNAPQQG